MAVWPFMEINQERPKMCRELDCLSADLASEENVITKLGIYVEVLKDSQMKRCRPSSTE